MTPPPPFPNRGDIWSLGYVLFEWDTYLLALMASAQAGRARDIAFANLIQVTLGRTPAGFVPNVGAGPRRTFDRSEPQVGARVLRAIVERWGEADAGWLLDGLLPIMLDWNDWAWARRRGEGVLGAGAPDGLADLLCLGSDASSPRSDVEQTLQAARYEGMDNAVIYDAPPAAFNKTSAHMNVYDVGASAFFASDTEATLALCARPGAPPCAPRAPPLPERLARVQAAMNAHMWDAGAGVYRNVLFNGTAIDHVTPTSFFPMLSGAASDAQAAALVAALAAPAGFCVNASHTPAPGAAVLATWAARDGAERACVSDACVRAAIEGGARLERIEAAALGAAAGAAAGRAAGLVALDLYADAASGATALVAGAPPGGNFTFFSREGWCWDAPPAGAGGWPTTALSLWSARGGAAFTTCGTAACEAAAAAAPGGARVRTMCFAFNATGADNMPCVVAGASIARADAAFAEQDYWRGRAWPPHHLLLYEALLRYDHVPAARAARADLLVLGMRVFDINWDAGVLCENANGFVGTCEDSGNADPGYTWGALFGFTSILEDAYKPAQAAP